MVSFVLVLRFINNIAAYWSQETSIRPLRKTE